MAFYHTIRGNNFVFQDLKTLLAKASPFRTGDALAGLVADSNQERVAAQLALSKVYLSTFLNEAIIPYEQDEITRLIIDNHDKLAFSPISSLTVGEFRDWLLTNELDTNTLTAIAKGLTPEMVAAVSKIMRNQDLIAVAQKCEVISKFRSTVGQKGRLSVRL